MGFNSGFKGLMVLFFIKGKVSRIMFKTKYLALHFIRKLAGYIN